jgi:hypothetical protein
LALRQLLLLVLALEIRHLPGVLLLDRLQLGLAFAPHHLKLLGMLSRDHLHLSIMMILDRVLLLDVLALD